VRRAEAGARQRSERRVAIKQGSPRCIPSFCIIIVIVVATMTAHSHHSALAF
jgi:hypothetical protein